MSPKKQEQNRYADSTYPTSPWTEAYHAAPQYNETDFQTEPQFGESYEALRPTLDALFDIYNRGY